MPACRLQYSKPAPILEVVQGAWSSTASRLDNGLHILIGAFRRDACARCQRMRDAGERPGKLPDRLAPSIKPLPTESAAPFPAPLDLVGGVLSTARGAPWAKALDAAARFMHRMRSQNFRLERDYDSDRECLPTSSRVPAFARYFWEPLCLAALNTPAPKCFCADFSQCVARWSQLRAASASEILLARVDLCPRPARSRRPFMYALKRGGEILTGRTVESIEHDTHGSGRKRAAAKRLFDHAICALSGPHRIAGGSWRACRISPDDLSTARLTLSTDLLRLSAILRVRSNARADARARRGCAVGFRSRSDLRPARASRGRDQRGRRASRTSRRMSLRRQVHRSDRARLGSLPALCVAARHRRRSARPSNAPSASSGRRPATALPRICLAGDYTASDYPATLEPPFAAALCSAVCWRTKA